MTITTNSPFPFNFRNVANVGDKIRAEILPAEEGQPAMYLNGTVIEKDASCFLVAIISTAGASRPWRPVARIPYGILSDWADRVTLVERAPVSVDDVRKALDGAKQMIDGMLTRDEILQREIDTLKAFGEDAVNKIETMQREIDRLHVDVHQLALQRTEFKHQRDHEALKAIAARRDLATAQIERTSWKAKAEKAEADYRDLRKRVLQA